MECSWVDEKITPATCYDVGHAFSRGRPFPKKFPPRVQKRSHVPNVPPSHDCGHHHPHAPLSVAEASPSGAITTPRRWSQETVERGTERMLAQEGPVGGGSGGEWRRDAMGWDGLHWLFIRKTARRYPLTPSAKIEESLIDHGRRNVAAYCHAAKTSTSRRTRSDWSSSCKFYRLRIGGYQISADRTRHAGWCRSHELEGAGA